ncbi:vacuolar assembling protein VPS41 [Rickenella mellea]|uniref:Vacuolar protein sorting-associated protein 41 n=1 Tax=Rickenella mellea TaxID=50990 RepID=A0A4R5XFY5_9AGAM|nr:vacuolar assembling protein VPS41 [Rickenella mellea]
MNGSKGGRDVEELKDGGKGELAEKLGHEHEHGEEEEDSGEDESEEDDDDDDDDEDEDEDEDEEPTLKYEKMPGNAHDLLEKDSASALAVSSKLIAIGTHAGIVHVLDMLGNRLKSFRPHSASINDMCIDTTSDFVATASVDGQVVVHSLSTPELYMFDMKRPMRTVALEPHFGKRSGRAFVCGGMAGKLVVYEKGWLGHKERVIHAGEGPIWTARWRGSLIAWANDLGVKIYDTVSQLQITYIDRPPDSPRADLFKCTLNWQDDSTLLISWADTIKVARIRARPRSVTANQPPAGTVPPPPLLVEFTAVFQVDFMIVGIVLHPTAPQTSSSSSSSSADLIKANNANTKNNATHAAAAAAAALTSFLVLAYLPPDTSFTTEATEDRSVQARKPAQRPELRVISRLGEELSSDVLNIGGYEAYGCNDYVLAGVPSPSRARSSSYVVLGPKSIVLVKPRDVRDHINWLVERKRYEEALGVVETITGEDGVDVAQIGRRYLDHLVAEGEYEKAAHLCPKVLGQDAKRWEDWIFVFAQRKQLKTIIPYIPTETPRLNRLVYEMVLAHFLAHDRAALVRTIRDWPTSIYDVGAVIVAIQSELDRSSPSSADTRILMECLAELYMSNRQPGKALPYFLRLRRPNVFALIRDNNLFTDVQDQALLLVEFDQELLAQKRRDAGESGESGDERGSEAVTLLVDHTYSIPVPRVVQQLQGRPYFLYLYLDALFDKDPHLASDYADNQVALYAEFAPKRLLDFFRASSYYSLQKAFNTCKDKDFVPEMVFLLGRMGDNKNALNLIIERLGDVHRAIDFAKEQNDDDLWEDLLRYSETKPEFIRGLLENVGANIEPIRLIRRIKNGLEIPGLKEALITILSDFNLQLSLLDGCRAVLGGDCSDLSRNLQRDQVRGFFGSAATPCPICNLPIYSGPQSLALLFLCRHVVHATCVRGGDNLPQRPDPVLSNLSSGGPNYGLAGKIAFAAVIKNRVSRGCPVCEKREEGNRT